MKQGWEIKKLGEIATYINGYAFKPEHWGEDGLPIIRIQNLNNPNAEFNYCSLDVPDKYVIDNGDILISWSASLGVYEWNQGKAYLNQHIFKVLFNKIDINKFFFKYAIGAKIKDMIKNAHGATMKHIVKGDFDNTPIPVPPLPVQEQIVSELDLLSGIIEKKREQLKELNALAQSIFYDMFGDPITNEKGWEVKKLKDVCIKLFAGGDVPKENYSETCTEEYNIPIYSNGIGDNALYGYTCIKKVEDVSITISGRGTIGYCEVRKAPFYPIIRLIVATPLISTVLPITLKYIIDNLDIKSTGGAIPQLTIPMIKDRFIPIPPLPLQHQFATKIEAIEKQKELIKQSISETETLFNARMQEHFG